ncbi:MAG: FG-GAP-like repeat-containing protein [Phycisphaerales bacterium]
MSGPSVAAQDGPILPVPVVAQDQGAIDRGAWFAAGAWADVVGSDALADLVVVQRGAWGTPGGDPIEPGKMLVYRGDGAGGFTPVGELAIAGDPTSLLLADATGDGRPDAIVTDGASSTASIYAGLGDGRFELVRTLRTGRTPVDAALADVTGDGVDDLLVCNYDHYYVGLHAGLPGGGFARGVRINVGTRPVQMAVVDLDGDGDLDVVTANQLSEDLSVAINDGGAFAEAIAVGPVEDPTGLAAGDLIGDDLPELIVTGRGGARLFTNDAGSLSPGPLVATTGFGGAVAVALADFGGDGLLDLAVGTNSGVEVYPGSASSPTGIADAAAIVALGLGLFDRAGGLVAARVSDGAPGDDLVIVEASRVVVALSGDAASTGGAPGLVGPREIDTGRASASVAGEFTGDGIPDILIAASDASRLLVGLGDGGFQDPTRTWGLWANDLLVARLRPGPLDDVIVDGSTVLLLRANGSGGFDFPVALVGGVRAAAVGDIDGDGDIDVVTGGLSLLDILPNDGAGNFAIAQTLTLPVRAAGIDIGDVTGDAVADIVVAAGSLAGTAPTPIYVFPGLGGGQFGDPRTLDSGLRAGLLVRTIDVGDAGEALLVLASREVQLWRGLDRPAPDRTVLLTTDDLVYDLDVLDFDGDGREDFTLSQQRAGLSIWRQGPESTFDRAAGFGFWSQQVQIADATGDGILDVLLGFGNLTALAIGQDGSLPGCAADLDGDGRATVLDFLQFQNWFDAGDPRADVDGDGTLTIFDFLRFQDVFDLGC